MGIFIQNIEAILKKRNLTIYELSKMIDYEKSSLYKMMKGDASFPSHVLSKISSSLDIPKSNLNYWIIADNYSKEIIELAIKHKKEIKKKRKELILTIKIDEILKQKGMSRTALSKEIKYSQSGLNRMITGKIPMSESIRERIAPVLVVSEEEILSWIVADKYSLKTLELATKED